MSYDNTTVYALNIIDKYAGDSFIGYARFKTVEEAKKAGDALVSRSANRCMDGTPLVAYTIIAL